MKVPIRNVYRLLLYAWRHLDAGEEASVTADEPRHLHDFFARVLADTVSRLVVRGLDRGYVPVEETLPGVRGRIDLGTAVKRGLLGTGRMHCRFDELQHDVLHNRIIKATMWSLLRLDLEEDASAGLRRLLRRLEGVSDLPRLTRRDFGRVQLHRNNRVYDFALRICRLVHEQLVVDPQTGEARFRDFRGDARAMGALFEAFVYRFFEKETSFRVSRPKVRWDLGGRSGEAAGVLPEMRTDVVLRSPSRRIIIETKFYAKPFAGRFGTKKLRSAHLYQLLTYLEHRAARGSRIPHEGMLLYPVVDRPFAYDFILRGHPVAVRSIDLSQPWPVIHADLLALVAAGP